MSHSKPTVTIDQAFQEFLAEQEARLSPATLSKYESILDLLRSCLEGYWPGHDQEEYDRITKAGGTYCGTFAAACPSSSATSCRARSSRAQTR
jgi:hypothetical protein